MGFPDWNGIHVMKYCWNNQVYPGWVFWDRTLEVKCMLGFVWTTVSISPLFILHDILCSKPWIYNCWLSWVYLSESPNLWKPLELPSHAENSFLTNALNISWVMSLIQPPPRAMMSCSIIQRKCRELWIIICGLVKKREREKEKERKKIGFPKHIIF